MLKFYRNISEKKIQTAKIDECSWLVKKIKI